MPEITQEDLDALKADAARAPSDADPAPAGERAEKAQEVQEDAKDAPASQTVTISKADLDELIKRASRGDQSTDAEPEPLPATHVAMLANGERFEYSGAHPTHVRDADGVEAQVIASYPLPERKPGQDRPEQDRQAVPQDRPGQVRQDHPERSQNRAQEVGQVRQGA